MHDTNEGAGVIELGAASALTQGDYCPGCFEALVIPDYFDMP